MTVEEADATDDTANAGRLRTIAHGTIGFLKGFSFGRHLNRRYD